MAIRHLKLFLFASLVGLSCCALTSAQEVVLFKGIHSQAVGFSQDGKWLAAAGSNPPKMGVSERIPTSGLVKVWNLGTGKEALHHVEDRWEATSLAFSPTAPLLAVGFDDRPRARVVVDKNDISLIYDENMPPVPVKIWNLKTLKQARSFLHDDERNNLDNINSISFSPDGSSLATANSKLQVWNVESGKKRFTMSEAEWLPSAVVFSPSGKFIGARTSKSALNGDNFHTDTLIELWDVATRKRTARFSISDDGRSLAFSSDGRFLALPGTEPKTVRVYDMLHQKVLASFRPYSTHFMCLTFSPDSKILYTGGTDGKGEHMATSWKAWESSTGRLLHTQNSPLTSCNALAVSPNGQRLATGGRDGTVRLWTLPKDSFGR